MNVIEKSREFIGLASDIAGEKRSNPSLMPFAPFSARPIDGAMRSHTHYDTLQLSRTANAAEIRTAYLALVRRYHPDLQRGDEAALREVIEAYAVLADPERRARYDRELALRVAADSASPGHPTQGGEMAGRERTMDVGFVRTPQTFSQLGVLVLDGSGSMADPARDKISKAQSVNVGVREMLTRFSVSRHKRNFSFAVVTFDEQASVHTPVTAVEEIDDNAGYDPMAGHGGGTDIGAGLREARRIAEGFLQTAPEDIPATAVIVVMSDGLDFQPERTLDIAGEIKANPRITICTTYFGEVGAVEPEAQEHLRALATDPVNGFKTVYDAESLRKFFEASVSAGTNLVVS
jgi:Mg-chelatase subunit ChlD